MVDSPPALRGQHILCFGPSDWWHRNPSCTTHIMRRLAEHNRVLYVNPFSADIPRRASRGLVRRIYRKLRSMLGVLRRAAPNLHTASPVFLPLHGNPTLDRWNNTLLRTQIKAFCRAVGVRPTIVWFENPRAADALDWFPDALRVFHVSDAFGACPYARDPAQVQRRDRLLTERCDALVCVSQQLFDDKSRLRRGGVHLLPHGVDYERFAEAGGRRGRIGELADIRGPIAGYYGTLTAQNDIELLEYSARALPEVTFVFVGTITAGDYGGLQRLPNTRFLSFMPYERMPELAASFDVALLPWRRTEFIKHCNPLKFLEYMASGRPIVSVPIPQVQALAGTLISFAATPEDFVAGLRAELSADSAQRVAARREVAQSHSWSAHAGKLAQIILPLLTQRRSAREVTCASQPSAT